MFWTIESETVAYRTTRNRFNLEMDLLFGHAGMVWTDDACNHTASCGFRRGQQSRCIFVCHAHHKPHNCQQSTLKHACNLDLLRRALAQECAVPAARPADSSMACFRVKEVLALGQPQGDTLACGLTLHVCSRAPRQAEEKLRRVQRNQLLPR